jgi:hypothetical protein
MFEAADVLNEITKLLHAEQYEQALCVAEVAQSEFERRLEAYEEWLEDQEQEYMALKYEVPF